MLFLIPLSEWRLNKIVICKVAKLKNIFLKSEFTKNTVVLVFGTVLAQAIPLILHPFLRRIYSVEDFGAMAVFLSVFSMITIVSALRYEATIVLPKNDNESANILSLTFVINLIFNSIILLVIVLFKEQLLDLIGLPIKYGNFLFFLPATSFLFSFYQSVNYWLIRQKAFKASSTNKIVRRAMEGAVQLGLGLFKIPGGLFIGDFFGNLANIISGVRQINKNKFSLKFVSKRKMVFVFKKFIDYPKYNVVPTLLSSAASLLPFLFINKMYSTEVVGYLDLSRMVLSIPLIFISATIAQVLFQQITEKRHQKASIKKDLLNICFILLGIILVEVIVLFFFGNSLFDIIFGENYVLSSLYSKILIFSFSFTFITATFSSVFITFDKIKQNSIWQVAYFIAICSLLFFNNLTIIEFLKVYVIIEVVMSLINIVMIFFIVRNYEQVLNK